MMNGELRVFPDKTALARAAAANFVDIAQSAIRLDRRFSVALSGGKTPELMYRLLATPEFSNQIDWKCVHFFWSDERCVPPNNPDSNYRIAWKSFIEHIPIPMENIFRVLGEDAPLVAAERYEQELKDHFRAELPRFNLILLGLGEDGHTASIFPDSSAVFETKRLVVAVQHPKTKQSRVTLTLPAINAAANITFLVSGESKREMLRIVRSGLKPVEEVPAIGVHPRDGVMHWLCDQAASLQ